MIDDGLDITRAATSVFFMYKRVWQPPSQCEVSEATETTSQLYLGFTEQPQSTRRQTPEGFLPSVKGERGFSSLKPWSGKF